jgi:hypothetical protein
MKISELYPKKYANGEDLKGQAFTLVVNKVSMETMHPQPGSPAATKPVIYFEQTQKGIILGPALARQIAGLLGDDTDTWKGKKVTIFPQPMRVAGRDVIAIRARAATNGTTPPPATLQEEEEES